MNGTSGDDVIVGLAGDDIIHGNGGNDLICGGDGNDTLYGDDGANSLSGDAGDDQLIGGPGNDVLLGGDGNDLIDGTGGNDSLDGGAGYDIVSYLLSAGPVSASLATGVATSSYAAPSPSDPGGAPSASTPAIVARTDSLAGIEAIFGSRFDDTLVGDGTSTNLLFGGPGNDTLQGGPGFDYLIGGAGDDIIDGGDGTDFVSYQRSPSPVAVNLANGTATGEGSDTITNVEGVDGSPGDDTIIGDAGTNFFVGEGGNDHMDGAAGFDFAIYSFATGPISADLTSGRALGDGSDTLASIEGLSGSDFADTLIGDAGANILLGGAGDDLLDGGGAIDILYGGDGVDNCVRGETLDSCEYSQAPLMGDANCDGTVNSIDAALVLQKSAGLIASLPCEENADPNGDANVNAVDVALILQYNAGLIQGFPLLNGGGGHDAIGGKVMASTSTYTTRSSLTAGTLAAGVRGLVTGGNSLFANNLQLLRRNAPLSGSGNDRTPPPNNSAASSALTPGTRSGASGSALPATIVGCFTALPGPGIGTSYGFGGGSPYAHLPVYLKYNDGSGWTFIKFDASDLSYYKYTDYTGCVSMDVIAGHNYTMFAYYDAGYCGVYSSFSPFYASTEDGLLYDLGTADTTPVGVDAWCTTVIPVAARVYSPSDPYALNSYAYHTDISVWGNAELPGF